MGGGAVISPDGNRNMEATGGKAKEENQEIKVTTGTVEKKRKRRRRKKKG